MSKMAGKTTLPHVLRHRVVALADVGGDGYGDGIRPCHCDGAAWGDWDDSQEYGRGGAGG